MEALVGICIAFCCALAAGAIAQKKKRNGTVWAWLTFLCAPLILLLLILPSKAQPWEIADDDTPSGNMIAIGRQITIERRQRGLFGRIVAVLFWGWQVVMGAWLITYWGQLGDVYN
jgi:fucose permease